METAVNPAARTPCWHVQAVCLAGRTGAAGGRQDVDAAAGTQVQGTCSPSMRSATAVVGGRAAAAGWARPQWRVQPHALAHAPRDGT